MLPRRAVRTTHPHLDVPGGDHEENMFNLGEFLEKVLQELESVRIGKCQNWKVSELESVRIGNRQNWKVSEFSDSVNIRQITLR